MQPDSLGGKAGRSWRRSRRCEHLIGVADLWRGFTDGLLQGDELQELALELDAALVRPQPKVVDVNDSPNASASRDLVNAVALEVANRPKVGDVLDVKLYFDSVAVDGVLLDDGLTWSALCELFVNFRKHLAENPVVVVGVVELEHELEI